MIKVGVIGYGYWGPNIVRNFHQANDSTVTKICDANQDRLKKAKDSYPDINLTTDYKEIVQASDIDVVAVITPVSSHFKLAYEALENGKHVFVEKPFTASTEEAKKLIDLAEKKGLLIMVDHTFLFNGAVKKIKSLVEEGALGDVLYYDSCRVNLGLFQHDVNVVWDLAPHDFSIMNHLIKSKPVSVSAVGKSFYSNKHEEMAYVNIEFDNGSVANLNFNWLSPIKVRKTMIGGKKKMLVWDDVEVVEKIKIYDHGVDIKTIEGIYETLVQYRTGDIYSPKIDATEALKSEVSYFNECINKKIKPINDGIAGLETVQLLEMASKSIKSNKKEYFN
jgi:predicted dehydrogenase